MDAFTAVGAYLADGSVQDPAALTRAGLAPHAYATLPREHRARPGFRDWYLKALARHHVRRQALRPLLLAWADRGIPALLFKGFWLDEFVYPVPGTRALQDVDVLIPQEAEATAWRLARDMGWTHRVRWLDEGFPKRKELFVVRDPTFVVEADVHGALIETWYGSRRIRELTDGVWKRSRRVDWEGIPVNVPEPADAVVVCLALAKSGGWNDLWRLGPFTLLDVREVLARGLVTEADLDRRADELGLTRVWRLFRRRCDWRAGTLDRSRPGPLRRGIWAVTCWPGRPAVELDRLRFRLRTAVPALADTARGFRHVARTLVRLRRRSPVAHLLADLPPVAPVPRRELRRGRLIRGVRWAVALLPLGSYGRCLVRSLAVCAALRRAGWPVDFVSGVARAGAAVDGHAWVELDGVPLHEMDPRDVADRYSVLVRSTVGVARGTEPRSRRQEPTAPGETRPD
ncbi:MAG TPA: lasso peptide biosynthesis B2 protein [Longimicrobiales bacterium]|jgi:hypothetical protein